MSLTNILVGAKLSIRNQIVNSSFTFLDYLTPANCEFHFAIINNDTILKKISKIKPSKALWLDNISGKLLQDTATVITPFLISSIYPWPKEYFLVIGKVQEYRLYINPEVEMSVAIAD